MYTTWGDSFESALRGPLMVRLSLLATIPGPQAEVYRQVTGLAEMVRWMVPLRPDTVGY